MNMRNKKRSAVSEDALREAKSIAEDFIGFTDGVRVLQLILRKADGGGTNNTKLKSVITTNTKEFIDCLARLIEERSFMDSDLRIYSCVNDRNFNKAIRHFKHVQLDADYGSDEMLESFYYNIHNKFVSALMQPSNKNTSYFLFDLDQIDNNEVLEKLAYLNIDIIKMYKSKQGWHIITKPFNPTLFESKNCSIHKDAMLLLKYI